MWRMYLHTFQQALLWGVLQLSKYCAQVGGWGWGVSSSLVSLSFRSLLLIVHDQTLSNKVRGNPAWMMIFQNRWQVLGEGRVWREGINGNYHPPPTGKIEYILYAGIFASLDIRTHRDGLMFMTWEIQPRCIIVLNWHWVPWHWVCFGGYQGLRAESLPLFYCSSLCDLNVTMCSKEAYGWVHPVTTLCPKAIHDLKAL